MIMMMKIWFWQSVIYIVIYPFMQLERRANETHLLMFSNVSWVPQCVRPIMETHLHDMDLVSFYYVKACNALEFDQIDPLCYMSKGTWKKKIYTYP